MAPTQPRIFSGPGAMQRVTACDGLEYAPQTVAVAEFLLAAIAPQDPYPIRVIQGDALSFTHYDDYDVIYMYRPFGDPVRMGWLVRRIADQMKVGAVMFDVFEQGLAIRKDCADAYVTVTRGADGFAQWNQPVSVDDFLARHALV